jgi:hypothetical protein
VKALGWLVIVILFLVLLGMLVPDTQESEVGNNQNNQAALKAVLARDYIKDATITPAGVLYVSVVDDGTKRDGLAMAMCEVVKQNRSSVTRVKIVKVNSSKDRNRDNAYGVLLGEAWCK